MKRGRVHPLTLVAAALVLAGLLTAPLPGGRPERANRSLALRLFGPIASLAANAQWVRADLAFRAGRVELYLSRAQTALALAPEAPAGWIFLAKSQAYTLGSPEREPDPSRRLAWIRAGLATAAEGEQKSSKSGELAFTAGLIMLKVATIDPRLPWPDGLPAIWDAAAAHLERAASLGYEPETMRQIAARARRAAAIERAGQ